MLILNYCPCLRHGYVFPKSNGDGDGDGYDNKPVEESMSIDDRIGVTIGSNAQKISTCPQMATKWWTYASYKYLCVYTNFPLR